jgi:hypothetical protein
MAEPGLAQEVHHATPRCLLRLWDEANGSFPDRELSPAFLEFVVEAERWRVPVEIERSELEELIARSAVLLDRATHRLLHENDFARWGRRGGLATVRRYGTEWMAALALKRWGRITSEDLASARTWGSTMRVEVAWTPEADYGRDLPCGVCGERFWIGPALAVAVTDGGVLMGEVCPVCLEGGPERMTRELERRAAWSRMQAEEAEEAASEPFGDCPTLDEFLALEAALGPPSPLRATVEEAGDRPVSTTPGSSRAPAGRKESLVDQRRQYVGGVAEEQRSVEERRFEELGLEEFFWSFVRLQARVDDLEGALAEARQQS